MTLTGRSVVVCRAQHQAGPLLEALAAAGATPVHVPLIEVVAPEDGGAALRRAVELADAETWWCFTSSNAVAAVAAASSTEVTVATDTAATDTAATDTAATDTAATDTTDTDTTDTAATETDTTASDTATSIDGGTIPPPVGRVAVVGQATAERVRSLGWTIDAVADEPTARGLGRSLPVEPGERVIAPLAELAGTDLADALRARGVDVTVVTAYRTTTPELTADDVDRVVASDAVLVTAPSVIQRLRALVGDRPMPPLVAIGPTSAEAIEAEGMEVAGRAEEPTVSGLIAAALRTLSA